MGEWGFDWYSCRRANLDVFAPTSPRGSPPPTRTRVATGQIIHPGRRNSSDSRFTAPTFFRFPTAQITACAAPDRNLWPGRSRQSSLAISRVGRLPKSECCGEHVFSVPMIVTGRCTSNTAWRRTPLSPLAKIRGPSFQDSRFREVSYRRWPATPRTCQPCCQAHASVASPAWPSAW